MPCNELLSVNYIAIDVINATFNSMAKSHVNYLPSKNNTMCNLTNRQCANTSQNEKHPSLTNCHMNHLRNENFIFFIHSYAQNISKQSRPRHHMERCSLKIKIWNKGT